jgi:uncharacterized protein (TIGR02594 family)
MGILKMSNISTIIKEAKDTLKMGMVSENVKLLQLALAEKGYALKGTGYFGPATDTAVETVQRNAGLKVDGEAGPLTAKIIDFLPAKSLLSEIKQAQISRPLWLEAGIKLIGVAETPGSKNTKAIMDWAKEDNFKDYTADSIPWCALFMNHILMSVGLKGTGTLWALDFEGKWPSVKLIGPAVGAFAPMKRTGGGHIICIVGKDQHGNIMGLGGNQSDAVTIAPFAVSRLNQGFYWPKGPTLPAHIGINSLPLVTSTGKVSINEA